MRWFARATADASRALRALDLSAARASLNDLPPLPAPHLCVDCCSRVREVLSSPASAQSLCSSSSSCLSAALPTARHQMLILQRSSRILYQMQSLQDWMLARGFVLQKVPEGFGSMAEASTHTSLAGGNYRVPPEYAHEFLARMVLGLSRAERYYFVEKRGAGNAAPTFKMNIDLDMVQSDAHPADQTYILRCVRVIQMTMARCYADSAALPVGADVLRAYVLTAPPKVQKSANARRAPQQKSATAAAAASATLADLETSPDEVLDALGHAIKRRRGPSSSSQQQPFADADAGCALIMSYGTHVHFPALIVTQATAMQLREACIHNLRRLCGARSGDMNCWEDVFDLSIYTENGLRMYGSDKWERKCSVCAGVNSRACLACLGRNGQSAGRFYETRFVLNGVEDWAREEALLESWQERQVEAMQEDGFPPFAEAAIEAEQIAAQHPELLTCTICGSSSSSAPSSCSASSSASSSASQPGAGSALAHLLLSIMQYFYSVMNWTEMYRMRANQYYAAMQLSIVVAPACPATPGASLAVWGGAARKSASTQMLEEEAQQRKDKRDQLRAAQKLTDRKESELAPDRERARKLLTEIQASDATHDQQLVARMIQSAVAENPNTRRFALMQVLFNKYLPSVEWRALYGGHAVRTLFHFPTVLLDNLLSNVTSMYRVLLRQNAREPSSSSSSSSSDAGAGCVLNNVFLAILQGPNSRFCHNIRKSHTSNNVAFLLVDGLISQVCFSEKQRIEGACCERAQNNRRRFSFTTEPQQIAASAITQALFCYQPGTVVARRLATLIQVAQASHESAAAEQQSSSSQQKQQQQQHQQDPEQEQQDRAEKLRRLRAIGVAVGPGMRRHEVQRVAANASVAALRLGSR